MPDDIPDFVMRALIDDRLTQIQADRDTELEDYLAALPTPIHLIGRNSTTAPNTTAPSTPPRSGNCWPVKSAAMPSADA